MNYALPVLIPLLPLIGFVLLALLGRSFFKNASGIFACVLLLISTIISLQTAYEYFFAGAKAEGPFQTIIPFSFSWLSFSESSAINMGIILDPISVMMLVVITFVSLMVHVYSLGYLKGEERYATYFSYLQLFTFSMLGLVMASNLLQIYIFWELVGVSSYLLIGYYYDRASAVAAAKKAFIVTRFADLGFLVGILIMAFYGETLDFQKLIERLTNPSSSQSASIAAASFIGVSALTWGLVLVFIGGAGKSAMFPLHIWLPNAMEGPTPVSALIHAATMVVAGVYLVARLFPLFVLDAAAMNVVTVVGIFSALFAALIACTQTDIKRVLAYSTMSQIGYMMFSLGISSSEVGSHSGFTASLFHLFTHAFFKSLLFLGAGMVIHFIHSNEMKHMGGLRKFLPVTHFTFLIACLAIAGIPPLAGFFSKEEILHAAHETYLPLYWVALLTSGITAFYMFRLYFSVFWNKKTELHHESGGEAPAVMKVPLILLALCTLAVGFIPFSKYVTASGAAQHHSFDPLFAVLPVFISFAGIAFAYFLYQKQNHRAEKISLALGGFYRSALHKFYVDEIFLFITRKIIFNLVAKPAAWIDRHVVDGTVNGIAYTTEKIAVAVKGIQSGKVQSYALYFFGGIVLLAIVFIYLIK